MVDAETDGVPVERFTVPRNQKGQLCVESIIKYLAGSGQILKSIGNGYPACKDGWSVNSYASTPIQLHVAPTPGRRSVAKRSFVMYFVCCSVARRACVEALLQSSASHCI